MPDGASFAGPDETGHVPAHPVASVLDTVGAGHGVAVGILIGWLKGLGLDQRRA